MSADALDDAFDAPPPSTRKEKKSKKRKAAPADDEAGEPAIEESAFDAEPVSGGEGEEAKRTGKKRKKSLQAKQRKRAKVAVAEAAQRPSVACQELALQADFLAEKQNFALPKLSALEREELRIPESFLEDTSSVTQEQRASLADFVTAALPALAGKLGKKSKKNGSPRLLALAGAALRVADLCREAKTLTAGTEVAKLFAKHFKLEQQVTHCQKSAFSAAIGTPDRVAKLISADALSLDSTDVLLLDVTHVNEKGRNMLEQPEARDALFGMVLNEPKVLARLKAGKMKLVLF